MVRILCVANQKGGVGKTTTTLNLASALARAGHSTLVVDLDPQCNATTGLGQQPVDLHPLLGKVAVAERSVSTYQPELKLLPGSRKLTDVIDLNREAPDQAARLVQHLRQGVQQHEFVLIDCPPSLGQLTRTALAASDEVLMPIQCEYYAMEGLTQMIEVIRDVMHTDGNRLQFGGILLTMYDSRLELTCEVDREVRDFFGEIVFETVIPRDVEVCEAPSHGVSVLDYAPRSRGTRAYIELCMEVMER